MDAEAVFGGFFTAMKQDKEQNLMRTGMVCMQVITFCSERRELERYSPELWEFLGYESAQEFQAVTADELMAVVHEEDCARICGELDRQLEETDSYQLEYRVCGRAGQVFWVLECGRRYEGADGNLRCSGMITDITELREVRARLLYQVSYDALTGIYNKRAFYRQAAYYLKAHQDIDFEIMRVDVERFKVINDLFGEKTGDRLLKYIANFFRNVNLPCSAYGRIHSDNFALFYPAGQDNRQRFITSLQTMAASFSLDYRIVLCFGAYRITDRTLRVSTMCDRAGMALNKAKTDALLVCGEYDEDMRQDIVNEQEIVNGMEEALEREEFVLYLQPKYELTTEKIVGAEALVRWIHPVRGFVPPSEFIPVFEQNGFIFKLDKYVWEKTCAILRASLDEGRKPMPISVNVSRIDLNNASIVRIFERLIRKYDLPAQLLELEFTESAYMDNPQQIIEIARELQALGFKILMDDFGSGYSSLNMLKDMPVDILKIDLKFLDSKDKSGRGGNILNSVVRMAKWLHIPVIAEGVETRQQSVFLRTIGCNYVQGYYYSRPVPLEKYKELVLHNDYHPDTSLLHLDAVDTDELLNPNAQLNLLFNSVTGGLGLYELNERGLELLRANDGYFEMFGRERGKVYDDEKPLIDWVYEEDRSAFMGAIRGTTEFGKITQCRLRRWSEDGRLLWLHARVSLVSKEERRQLLYLALEDVTELQKKTQEMQSLFDHIPGGVGIYELDGEVLRTRLFSRWLYEINGIDAREFMTKNQGDLRAVLPEATLNFLKREIVRAYEEKHTVRLTYPFRAADGRLLHIQAEFNTLKEGRLFLCYAFLQDITAFVELKEGK